MVQRLVWSLMLSIRSRRGIDIAINCNTGKLCMRYAYEYQVRSHRRNLDARVVCLNCDLGH